MRSMFLGLPLGPLRRSRVDEPGPRLKRRLARDGYLFLPGLLPAALSESARAEAISRGLRTGGDLRTSEAVRRFARAAPLRRALKTLLGPFTFHPLPFSRQCRVYRRGDKTPPHQDLTMINTCTAWIPAGDVPMRLGGLTLIPGSYKLGALPHTRGGSLFRVPKIPGLRWATSDYAAGDVVIFHAWMVHTSTPNRTKDGVRTSFELRFCPRSELTRAAVRKMKEGSIIYRMDSKAPVATD